MRRVTDDEPAWGGGPTPQSPLTVLPSIDDDPDSRDGGSTGGLLIEPPPVEGLDHPIAGPFDQPRLQPFADLSLAEIAEAGGLRRIDVLAWRDFDDPEAGGSELHAHRILSAWAAAGLDLTMTTSSVPGERAVIRRDGYRVVRRAGRYSVFPRTMASGALGQVGSGDGLVEIWNGMPFLSPLWSRAPRVVFLHHVHAEMWKMVLPRGLAELGYAIEHRLAPPVYRRSRIVTLSTSAKGEIVDRLGAEGLRERKLDAIIRAPYAVDGSIGTGARRRGERLAVESDRCGLSEPARNAQVNGEGSSAGRTQCEGGCIF